MTAFYTPADLDRYTGQKREILWRLAYSLRHGSSELDGWVDVESLEWQSKAKRVASRIDELRDDWEIETRKNPVTKRAMYRLVGKRTELRERKAHCETCTCREPEPTWWGQDLEVPVEQARLL